MPRIELGGVAADPTALAVGESTIPRFYLTASPLTSTSVRLGYFRARKTELITQLRLLSGAAAGATPTLCRAGIYSVADSGDITLVAATANDTTLFAAASASYTRSLIAPVDKSAGQMYAVGILVISAAAMPSVASAVSAGGPTEQTFAPRTCGIVGGQTDLPDFVAAGSIGATSAVPYGVLLP